MIFRIAGIFQIGVKDSDLQTGENHLMDFPGISFGFFSTWEISMYFHLRNNSKWILINFPCSNKRVAWFPCDVYSFCKFFKISFLLFGILFCASREENREMLVKKPWNGFFWRERDKARELEKSDTESAALDIFIEPRNGRISLSHSVCKFF